MVVSNKNSVFHNIWREFDVRSRSLFFCEYLRIQKKISNFAGELIIYEI
jgi:hypothetical protein